jgi:hypothetical protein
MKVYLKLVYRQCNVARTRLETFVEGDLGGNSVLSVKERCLTNAAQMQKIRFYPLKMVCGISFQ